jgi:microcystin-dependent protein
VGNYSVIIDGQAIGVLESGKYATYDVSLNEKHEVVVVWDINGTLYPQTMVTKYFTSQGGEKQTFALPGVGWVKIKHSSSSKYIVYIDGKKDMTLTKADTYVFPFSAGVTHTIELVQQDGYLLYATHGIKTINLKESEIIEYSGPRGGSSEEYFNE